jgi:small ligand-binding sensory domain FIST
MMFAQAHATGADLDAAARDVAAQLRQRLGDGPVDLVVVFASAQYGQDLERLPGLLHDALGPRTLVGCTGARLFDGATGGSDATGLVALAGRAPGARLDAVVLDTHDLPDEDAPPTAWRALLPARATPCEGMLVLGEPFHADPRRLIDGLDFAFPGVPKVGGIASGSRHPQGHALFCGRRTVRRGAVVLALGDGLALEPVIATGCRAFGRTGRITRSEGNRLIAVDAAPAKDFVKEQILALDEDSRTIAETSPLLVGIDADPFADVAGEPEWLVRNVLGVDDKGNLAVGEHLPVGRAIRLLMRDTAAGADDARLRLRRARPQGSAAALLFQCLGRESDDCAAFAAAAAGVPLAGFACNGEIGPLGGATRLHAFTAAFALLRATEAR